jgi:hypothetical protein
MIQSSELKFDCMAYLLKFNLAIITKKQHDRVADKQL